MGSAGGADRDDLDLRVGEEVVEGGVGLQPVSSAKLLGAGGVWLKQPTSLAFGIASIVRVEVGDHAGADDSEAVRHGEK